MNGRLTTLHIDAKRIMVDSTFLDRCFAVLIDPDAIASLMAKFAPVDLKSSVRFNLHSCILILVDATLSNYSLTIVSEQDTRPPVIVNLACLNDGLPFLSYFYTRDRIVKNITFLYLPLTIPADHHATTSSSENLA